MSNILLSQFILFLFVFIRLTAMIAVAPVFGDEAIPAQAKIALGLFLSLTFFPIAAKNAPSLNSQLAQIVVTVFQEATIGLLMGFSANMIFSGAMMAGEFISFNMGLGFAHFFDPNLGQSVTVLSRFFYVTSILIFLAINGHHFLLESLQLSYSTVPIGGLSFNESMFDEMMKLSRTIFIVAVKISAPAVVCLFLTNVVLAILARVVPQMNVFLVGFPLQVATGLLVLLVISPLMVFVFKKLLLDFEENFFEFVKVI